MLTCRNCEAELQDQAYFGRIHKYEPDSATTVWYPVLICKKCHTWNLKDYDGYAILLRDD